MITPPKPVTKNSPARKVFGSLRKLSKILLRSSSHQSLTISIHSIERASDIPCLAPLESTLRPLKTPFSISPRASCHKTSRRVNSFYTPLQLSSPNTVQSPSSAVTFDSEDESFPVNRKNYAGTNCSVCQESLSSVLAGEHCVLLKCGHGCHSDCVALVSGNSGTMAPQCGVCVESATTMSDNRNSIVKPVTGNSSTLMPSYLVHPDAVPVCTQEIAESAEKPSIDSLVLWPHITTIHNTEAREYSFEIKAPLANTVLQTFPPDIDVISNHVRQSVEKWLSDVTEGWSAQFLADLETGELLMFDSLYVSTDGKDWDRLAVFCFRKVLVLTTSEHVLVGGVWIHEDISSINSFAGYFTLNLMLDGVPEISFKLRPLVLDRWMNLLRRTMARDHVSTNLYQLTITAWNLISSLDKLPQDVIAYAHEVSSKYEDAHLTYLARAVLTPPVRPLNLVLLLPLVNTLDIPNDQYRSHIVAAIYTVLDQLKPVDRLSLVLIGVDGNGNIGPTGRFIGCAESKWDGWQKVIDDIVIVPKTGCPKNQEIFPSDSIELVASLEKCVSLLPFLSRDNVFNKLVVVSVAGNGPKNNWTRNPCLPLNNDRPSTPVSLINKSTKATAEDCANMGSLIGSTIPVMDVAKMSILNSTNMNTNHDNMESLIHNMDQDFNHFEYSATNPNLSTNQMIDSLQSTIRLSPVANSAHKTSPLLATSFKTEIKLGSPIRLHKQDDSTGKHSQHQIDEMLAKRLFMAVKALDECLSISLIRIGGLPLRGVSDVIELVNTAGSTLVVSCRALGPSCLAIVDTLADLADYLGRSIRQKWQRVVVPKLLLELDARTVATIRMAEQTCENKKIPIQLPSSPNKAIKFVVRDITMDDQAHFVLGLRTDLDENSFYCISWSDKAARVRL